MISKKEFSKQVETILAKTKGDDVMGAIIKTCDINQIEPESAKRLLTDPLKERLEAEANKLRMINRGNSSQGVLPI